MLNDINSIYNRIRNLAQYREKSEAEVLSVAKGMAIQKKKEIDIVSKFKDKGEKKLAKDLIKKYLDDYIIETISDKNTLKEVIYLEVVQNRLQDKLNTFYEKESKAVPLQLVEAVQKNTDAIIKLKNSLGLIHSKEIKDSDYNILEKLKNKFEKWREDNQASRTLICPHCGKMVLLKIRTDVWEAQKHPFFKDRILYNKHLIYLLKKKVITRDDIAKVLECSPDYVDWIIEKIEKSSIQ